MPGEIAQVVNQPSSEDEAFNPNYQNYDFAAPRLKRIVEDWKVIEAETKRLRGMRYIRVDREYLKQEGKFKEDETYVATRLIDSNVRTEQPQYISYLTQSRRAAVFIPLDGQTGLNTALLEEQFTLVSRYLGWESPFIRNVDGTQTHGWDSVEVVFDPEMPGHFSIEHVGHENLLFDRHTEDIQAQELILRKVKYTALQLRANVKLYGFDAEQVKKLISNRKDNDQGIKDVKYDVYKGFYKDSYGIVWVCWYHPDCDSWLAAPAKLFLGIRDTTKPPMAQVDGSFEFPPKDETEYPFYIHCYYESENETVAETKGRGYLDEPSQEAASAILSGIVNGTNRAAQPYASLQPRNPEPNPNSEPPKQIDCQMLPGRIYDKPIDFFSTPFPPISAIQSFQMVTTANRAETAKPDFAVENRRDSRKTATEVASAKETSAQLTGVQVVQFSTFIRRVYTRCWKIYQARVLQQNIKLGNPELAPLFSVNYMILSSGDIDVLQRQEKIQKQMQAWDVLGKTPVATELLKDIIRNMFPEEASKYIKFLEQSDPRQLVMKLATVLNAIVEAPEVKQEIAPYAQQLQALGQEVQSYLSSSGVGEQMNETMQQTSPPTEQQPPSGNATSMAA